MEFNNEFKLVIKVKFKNPENAVKHFIEGAWKDSFYDFDDLDEVSEHLSFAFNYAPDEFISDLSTFKRFVEGFGDFVRDDFGVYTLTSINGDNDIEVRYDEELYVDWTYKVTE